MYMQNDIEWSHHAAISPSDLDCPWQAIRLNEVEVFTISIYIPPNFPLIHLRSEVEDPLALPLTLSRKAAEPFVSH